MPTILLGNISSWQTFSSIDYITGTTGVMTSGESSNRADGKSIGVVSK